LRCERMVKYSVCGGSRTAFSPRSPVDCNTEDYDNE
jgi:hypothetical protein